MTKHLIVVNPAAGRGIAGTTAGSISQILSRLQLEYDLVFTEGPQHGVALAQEAVGRGYDAVIAVGGDGTFNEILNGVMTAAKSGARTPALGVLPIGTGNDFAYSAGIPLDLEASCALLASGEKRKVDIGWLQGGNHPEGRYFANGVGVGFDAVVNIVAHRMKGVNGPLLYLAAVLKTLLLRYTTPRMQITLDGETFEQNCVMVSLMNGRRMGGVFLMTPESLPDDGHFDLCIAGRVSRPTILTMLPRFMKGTQAGHPAVRFYHAREITIQALSDSLVVHADGEEVSEGCPRLVVRLFPGRLEVFAPHNPPTSGT
jgi:diacylglycerol kinase (ATP)